MTEQEAIIKKILGILDHFARMEAAGTPVATGKFDFGPDRYIRRISRGGVETWQILPDFLAMATVANIAQEEPDTASAMLYRELPDHAPRWVKEAAQEKATRILCEWQISRKPREI